MVSGTKYLKVRSPMSIATFSISSTVTAERIAVSLSIDTR